MSNFSIPFPVYLNEEEKIREFNSLAEYFLTNCDIADGLTQKELILCMGNLMNADEDFFRQVMVNCMNITLSIMADSMQCRKKD